MAFLLKNKEHLTEKGLEEIRNISSNMNTGRSFEDKYEFLKKYLNVDTNGNVNFKLPEHWVQTFIDGEGMFYNYISENVQQNRITIDSSLEIAQGNHDVFILLAIKNFFNGGYIKPKYEFNSIIECKESRSVNRFILRDSIKIIEFVNNFPMLTQKQLDYLDWKTIVELKNSGSHKSPEGFNLIKEIKANMNSKRN